MNDRLIGCDTRPDKSFVETLVSLQCPRYAGRDLRYVESSGTDNNLWRLGTDLVVRLPRFEGASQQVLKEAEWLPVLAPQLPLKVPQPVFVGNPADDYPFHWSVCPWFEGQTLAGSKIVDEVGLAKSLGGFVRALHSAGPDGGPPPGAHNFYRGVPLEQRDEAVRESVHRLRDEIDADKSLAIWEESLASCGGATKTCWIHGDLHPGNILIQEERVCAVIDFGGMAVGDPACDMMAAWTLLDCKVREAFRHLVDCEDAVWERGRGWALSFGLIALAEYRLSNQGLAKISRLTIDRVLGDG